MEKTIHLTVNGTKLGFNITTAIYNKYINELEPNKKVGPAENLLTRAVLPDFRAALKTFLELPSMANHLAAVLLQDYLPDVEITVGE